jgi:hypothetical protein
MVEESSRYGRRVWFYSRRMDTSDEESNNGNNSVVEKNTLVENNTILNFDKGRKFTLHNQYANRGQQGRSKKTEGQYKRRKAE